MGPSGGADGTGVAAVGLGIALQLVGVALMLVGQGLFSGRPAAMWTGAGAVAAVVGVLTVGIAVGDREASQD